MEDFNFKKFEGVGQKLENRITVTSSNSFGFPGKFYMDEKLEDKKYLTIYFDEAKRAIALHFSADENEHNKFTVMKSKIGNGASVVATSFFRTYNIVAKNVRGRYVWERRDIEGIGAVYIIKLPE